MNCMAIPCVAHDKLHETCMFHSAREGGTRQHITKFITVVSCDLHCHASLCIYKINEVTVEQYHNHHYSGLQAIISDIVLHART